MKQKKVLCFGDSNTYGFCPRQPNTLFSSRFNEAIRWPRVMGRLLGPGFKVEEQGQPGRTVGFYGEGETYASGLALIGDFMRAAAPVDLLVLMLGSNDLQLQCSPDVSRITADLRELVQTAQKPEFGREDAPAAVLLVAPVPFGPQCQEGPFAEFYPPDAPAMLEELRAAQRALAEELGLAFFDAATVAKTSPHDGLHLDAESHAALGVALAGVVPGLLAE